MAGLRDAHRSRARVSTGLERMLTGLGDKYRQIRHFDPCQHWLCDIHDSSRGPSKNDRPVTQLPLEERLTIVMMSLRVFIYDGPTAEQYQKFLKEGLAKQLSGCDFCILAYYVSRRKASEDMRQ